MPWLLLLSAERRLLSNSPGMPCEFTVAKLALATWYGLHIKLIHNKQPVSLELITMAPVMNISWLRMGLAGRGRGGSALAKCPALCQRKWWIIIVQGPPFPSLSFLEGRHSDAFLLRMGLKWIFSGSTSFSLIWRNLPYVMINFMPCFHNINLIRLPLS